ncbi:MAG: sugar phosphate isomerase/epimerase [Acidobacteria bacterium]|nr:sugar phosphate isomerase/epimerase [Acidobacteriota bacterium]
MPTRREFLTTAAAALGAATTPALAWQTKEIVTRLNAPVGLQLWSLRAYLPKDLSGTLANVRRMGFREVEGAGLWGRTAAELRQALDTAGLRCQSAHLGYERLRDDLTGALNEARAVGATWVVCPWIPHENAVTREQILRAADLFTRAARTASQSGLRFAYHCHGYEFVPADEGTLFDTLARNTDQKLVEFQIDVFHAFYGGADPAALIRRHAPRVTSLHLKDLKKGTPVVAGTGTGTPDIDVPVGSGALDMSAVLRAAMKAATRFYYLEDESADPLTHIPRSVAWLESVAL